MDPKQLRHHAEQAQQGAQREQGRISRGEVDPDYIRRLEHFPGLSHAEIYAHTQAMDPGDMQAQAAVWVDIADNLTGAITGLHSKVQSALADGIRGRIGDAAAERAREFVRWATDITDIAHSTGHRMIAAAYGAEAVRRTVPPPSAADTDPLTPYLSTVIGSAPGAHARADAREELHQIALAAMEANYIPTYPPAGSGVPAFGTRAVSADANPSNELESPPAQPISPHGGTNLRTEPIGALHHPDPSRIDLAAHPEYAEHSGDPNHAAAQGNNGQPLRDDRLGTPSDEDTSPGAAAHDGGIRDSDRTSDPTTTPAATPGGGNPTTTVAPDRSITTPGSPFEFPTAITPRGFSNPRQPIGSPIDPGHSYPGPPLPGTRSTPTPSAAPTGSAAQSMGLLPGMHPTPGRGSSDTDATHRTPDWLIRNRQHELLGTPPPTVPAVLGAEIPAAGTGLDYPEADTVE